MVCPFCKLESKDLNELKKHFENVHTAGKRVNNLQDEIDNKGSEICSKCPSCSVTGNKIELDKHLKSKHRSPYTCDECGNNFPDSNTLDSHIKSKHKSAPSTEPFPCEWCGLVFINFNLLQEHITSFHATQSENCKYCTFKADDQEAL